MADDADTAAPEEGGETKKKPKGGILVPLLLGMNLALMLGGGAAFAIMSGAFEPPAIVADLLGAAPAEEDGHGDDAHGGDHADDGHGDDYADDHGDDHGGDGYGDDHGGGSAVLAGGSAFVDLDELTVTITSTGAPRQLRVRITIETPPAFAHTVEGLRPRILDALNTLLRAIHPRDLADPAAFDRLRAQLLRRVRISVDPAAIRDLLITEYVIF